MKQKVGFATIGARRPRIIETATRHKEGRPIACRNGGRNRHDIDNNHPMSGDTVRIENCTDTTREHNTRPPPGE